MNVGDRKTIQQDKTGLLVRPSEWSAALEELILNEKKRTELGENAYKDIIANWQYEDSDISDTIEKVINI
jgi:glycosyltransferase involved in cell wall biosynthesis